MTKKQAEALAEKIHRDDPRCSITGIVRGNYGWEVHYTVVQDDGSGYPFVVYSPKEWQDRMDDERDWASEFEHIEATAFAKYFLAERARLNMSRRQLAEEMKRLGYNYSPATLKNWESGRNLPHNQNPILEAMKLLAPLPAHLGRFRRVVKNDK